MKNTRYNPAWFDDLKAGERLEHLFMNKLNKSNFFNLTKVEGHFKEFDLIDTKLGITFEIKRDLKSQETENIIIEIEMPKNNPSGLKTTQAKFWIIETGTRLYWIEPNKIWHCITDNELTSRVLKGNGDYDEKVAYLIPVRLFEHYVSRVEESLLTNVN